MSEYIERLKRLSGNVKTIFSYKRIKEIIEYADKLEAENEQLRKDAERYRWISSNYDEFQNIQSKIYYGGSEIEKAIDKEMAEPPEKP